MSQLNREIAPGFMVIQGNRMEDLQQIAIEWSRTQPLAPLKREVYLVQSNGIAQWMKMALAADPGTYGAGGMGIATALDVMLPARFQWLAYRQVIEQKEGKGAVPIASPFDKPMLRWRLMRMLPEKLSEPVYAPLAKFLDGDDGQRKQFQLAERLADLYDQYQVYRADWLDQWTAGHDRIISPKGVEMPLPDEDRWQAQLWRDIHDDMPKYSLEKRRRFTDLNSAVRERECRIGDRVIKVKVKAIYPTDKFVKTVKRANYKNNSIRLQKDLYTISERQL